MSDAWNTIDSAPMDGSSILAWDNEVVILSYRYDENDREQVGGRLWLDNSYDDFSCGLASTPYTPTHWMPLPTPPEEQK